MSEDPEKKSFMKDLEKGISVRKKEKDNFFSEKELKAKKARAKKVRQPRPMIESNVLLEVARLAQMPKLTSVKNKQLLKDVHELRGWMEKGPDFCNYENAFAPWQRIQQEMNQAFLDGDMDVFSDFATAWHKWKKSPNFEKLTDDKFRDRHSDSIAVVLYRAFPASLKHINHLILKAQLWSL